MEGHDRTRLEAAGGHAALSDETAAFCSFTVLGRVELLTAFFCIPIPHWANYAFFQKSIVAYLRIYPTLNGA